MISFKLVSEDTVRILIDSLKAENGAKHNGPSGTMINSLPRHKSAMGPIIASFNGCNESVLHYKVWPDSPSPPLVDGESSVGSCSERFSYLTPTAAPVFFKVVFNNTVMESS